MGLRRRRESRGCIASWAWFKPVEVLYNGNGFLLVRANAPEDRENLRLRPGDEIIITANDLYDGKVVGQKNGN